MQTKELTAYNGGFSPELLNNLPMTVKRSLKQDSALTIKQTYVAGLHEQGRAMLANTALENIGARKRQVPGLLVRPSTRGRAWH